MVYFIIGSKQKTDVQPIDQTEAQKYQVKESILVTCAKEKMLTTGATLVSSTPSFTFKYETQSQLKAY